MFIVISNPISHGL